MNQSSDINLPQTHPTANVSSDISDTTVTAIDKGMVSYLLPGVLLGALVLYVIVEVWAFKRDRQDRAMVGATVIPHMRYHRSPHNYMLQFYTGSGRHDGTTANVYCCLHGNKRQTKPIVLRDSERLLFQRGTLSSFLVTFNHSLDQIKRIHIWHDIAGPDPPWFLERVVVCHLNTGLTWHFQANRWLDVSQGDGTVECILKPEPRRCLLGSKRLFDRQLPDNFRNKHMWFSPFLLKEETKFSRAQRVRCCGCLIGLSMLVVSVIIQTTRNLNIFPSGFFRLGPMRIALADTLTAATCAGIVFASRLLLEVLMRKAKREGDLSPDEKDVRGYLEYYKHTSSKIVFLDDPSNIESISKNSEEKELDISCSKDPNTLEGNDDCGTKKEEIQKEEIATQELFEGIQLQNMERKTEKDDVHSVCNEEEDFSGFAKKLHPSVKLQNKFSATQSFASLEGLEEHIVPEQQRPWTDGLNEEAGTSCFSCSDTDSDNLMSDVREYLTHEDIQIVEGKHDVKEHTSGRSFTLMQKNNSLQEDNWTSYSENGLGALQNNCKDGEEHSNKNTGDISSTHAQFHGENSSPKKHARKASRETVEKDPEEQTMPCIVDVKIFDYESEPTIIPSPETRPRTVNNIDNAPRLWKALPFPREHLDKHSLKKLNEDNVYNLSRTWLIVTAMLCAIFPLTASAVTIAFGLSWSFEVIISWLVTVALALVIQCFIMETIFLVCHALYSAFWLKRPQDERNLLHELMNKVCIQEDYNGKYFVDDLEDQDRSLIPRPPTTGERREAREKASRDRELEQVLVMIVSGVLFLLLLVIIGLGNRDQFSYSMKKTMENTFNPSHRFMNISNADKFWLWAKRDLILGVYDKQNNNFLSDKYNSLLGPPILRQKRLRKGGTCPLPKEDINNFFDECRARFVKDESEDKDRYHPGWQSHLATVRSNHSSSSPWSYQSQSESHTEYSFTGRVGTHGGGGYIAKLGFEQESAVHLLNDLQTHTWIDSYTRTVVFELSTYNANVNILSVLSFSIEFTPSNGALPRIDLFTFRLYRYLIASQLIFLICEAVFVAFVVQLIYRTVSIISLEGKAYFASAWNYSELLLILFSLITIGLYGARANNLAKAIKNIQKDSSVFYGFYSIAVSDNLVAYMSCLVFIVPVIQFLRFLKFNKDFMVFYFTLSKIRSEITGFVVIMFISLLTFSLVAFMMLRTREESYATFMSAMGNMLSLTMGSRFSFRILKEFRNLGPLFTYIFTIVNMFVLLNIVLSIISNGFSEARRDESFQKSEYEVVAFIINRVKGFFGLLPPYMPPPPKIARPNVSYLSEQCILNTRYITENQVHRLDSFVNNSYCDDFLDDFHILISASGISYKDDFVIDLLQCLAIGRQFPEENEPDLVDTSCTLDEEEKEENIEQFRKIEIVPIPARDEIITAARDERRSRIFTGSTALTSISESCEDLADIVPQRYFLYESESNSNTEERSGKAKLKTKEVTLPKSLKYSLRRQLYEASLRNARSKIVPDIMRTEEMEFEPHGEAKAVFDHKDVNEQNKLKPGASTSIAVTKISHNRNESMPRCFLKRAGEVSTNQMSQPHPQDETLERYRCAIENELVCGVQQVFVKSACLTRPSGQRKRSLEKRRWSID